MTQKLTFRLIAFAFAFSISLSYSAVRTWIGNTNNSWTTNSNWTGGNRPGSSDDVILTGAGTYQPTTNVSGTIRSLSLNGGNLTLTGNLTITTTVLFFDGIITTSSSNLLILNAGATVSGANDTSHVNGPVRKRGNSYGSFTFPTGNGSIYASIRVSSVGGGNNSDYFQAQYFHDLAPYNMSSKDASLSNLSTLEYWNLISNDLRAVVTLSHKSPRSGGISNLSFLKVARWDGSVWRNHGGNTTGTTSAGTVATTSTLTAFGPFTLSTTNSMNALPVNLIDFNAKATDKKPVLEWSTASEVNLSRFEIYRSTDGQKYSSIGMVNASFNGNDLTNYSFTDNSLENTNGTIVYYRLKMIDTDGTYKLSNISQIRFDEVSRNPIINIFPNPTTDNINVQLVNTNDPNLLITITDLSGKSIISNTYHEMSGNIVSFDVSNLENGIYFINIIGSEGKPASGKFIKR